MTPIDVLLRRGPMSAHALSLVCRMTLVDVYSDLVAREAAGEVEVRYEPSCPAVRVWASTWRAVPDADLPTPLRGRALEAF